MVTLEHVLEKSEQVEINRTPELNSKKGYIFRHGNYILKITELHTLSVPT